MQKGRDRSRALSAFTSLGREAYGFFVAVSFFMLVSIFIALSIFMLESAAGAGAIAGAAAVSTGVSSLVLHAARASTAATRARRFIYILLVGDDQRLPWSAHAVPGSAAESTESSAGVKAVNVVQVQGQQCVYVTSARVCKLRPSRTGERRLPTERRSRLATFYCASAVFGNSMRRNVLQRPLGSVAPRLRGAYLFEVDPRLSSNVPGREHRNSR